MDRWLSTRVECILFAGIQLGRCEQNATFESDRLRLDREAKLLLQLGLQRCGLLHDRVQFVEVNSVDFINSSRLKAELILALLTN